MRFLNSKSLVSLLREGEAYTADTIANVPTKKILGTYNLETGECRAQNGELLEPTTLTAEGCNGIQFDTAAIQTILWDGIEATVKRMSVQPTEITKNMLCNISEAFFCSLVLVGVDCAAARQTTNDMVDFITSGML